MLSSVLILILSLCGCGYFEVYKKTSYVSQVTSVIGENQKEINNYIDLTNQEDLKETEFKDKLLEIKGNFEKNKKDLEVIVPPEDYKKEHENFVEAFQYCIDSVDASIELLDIDKQETELRMEKIELVKSKVEEAKKLIKAGINKISIDLR